VSISDSHKLDQLVLAFPNLFSDQLGMMKGMVCRLDLIDDMPVHSRPYQCSPPCLQALQETVKDLLKHEVIRKIRESGVFDSYVSGRV
jgi:hypothetical protein